MSKYHMGVDLASGKDKCCMTIMVHAKHSWFRRSLRRLKIDRSTWEYKVVDQWFL